jgi:hypothetical protein
MYAIDIVRPGTSVGGDMETATAASYGLRDVDRG